MYKLKGAVGVNVRAMHHINGIDVVTREGRDPWLARESLLFFKFLLPIILLKISPELSQLLLKAKLIILTLVLEISFG